MKADVVRATLGFVCAGATVLAFFSQNVLGQRGAGPGDAPGAAAIIADDPPLRAQTLSLTDLPSGSARRALFNGKSLDGWDTWLSIPDASKILTSVEAPIGLNADATGVFSVVQVDRAPAIRISGTINGALLSKDDFENYHLRLQYKWGTPIRSRNSGLLYHSHGALGASFGQWMSGVELAIQQGQTGAAIPVGAKDGATNYADMAWLVGLSVPVGQDSALGYPKRRYMSGGRMVPIVYPAFNVRSATEQEKPDEWNTVELYAFGDRSIHVVNGVPVLEAFQLTTRARRNAPPVPLTRGRLQLESEGGELFVRDIVIESITHLPRVLAAE